jgi:hypothetical protein
MASTRYNWAIVIRRKGTILYVYGPYTTKKAAQADLKYQAEQEAFCPGQRWDASGNSGWVFENGAILKQLDVQRMIKP